MRTYIKVDVNTQDLTLKFLLDEAGDDSRAPIRGEGAERCLPGPLLFSSLLCRTAGEWVLLAHFASLERGANTPTFVHADTTQGTEGET